MEDDEVTVTSLCNNCLKPDTSDPILDVFVRGRRGTAGEGTAAPRRLGSVLTPDGVSGTAKFRSPPVLFTKPVLFQAYSAEVALATKAGRTQTILLLYQKATITNSFLKLLWAAKVAKLTFP
jgi:hypothetical protein